ncbi:restriction endonuclease subunit S [Luteolibacter ambystomatis]|uniref:Restriction endonuclease subunit S n=1 Tax=Luteolibacter ambystomatis TaxID=2824561 RepID=A0A975IZ37_9BACT|nr:restriction endonuclease subunit S [Luteolibacter ambystomatis]QUE50774.1 restriction endonuclease subunit S [Luteolibacter ambystomatis]
MAAPLFDCPKDWEKATLEPDKFKGLIVSVATGSTPATTVDEYWDGDVPWLTPKEITGDFKGLYVSATERNITSEGLKNSSAKLLPPGTVMLSKRAPVGAVAVNTVPMATNQGFMNFVCGHKLRPLYLALWLKANITYLDRVANGSTYPELYKNDLFEFEICAPSVETQDQIVNAILSLEFAILLGAPLEQTSSELIETRRIRGETARLDAACSRLIPLLLSGQLDPRDFQKSK